MVGSVGRDLAEVSLALVLLGLLGTPRCLDVVADPVEWCADHTRDEMMSVHVEGCSVWFMVRK